MPRLLAVLAALAHAGTQSARRATLDRVRDSGVFRIGYRADAKPYSYRNDQGQPAGYIVDLCLEVAARRSDPIYGPNSCWCRPTSGSRRSATAAPISCAIQAR